MAVASLPKNLTNEIKRLEELFTLDTAKLKEITHHFVDELTKGELHQRPTNVPVRPKC
jgi:hexokinase